MYTIKRSHIYFIMLSALFIHVTCLDYVKVLGAKPDLMLICVIFLGLFFGEGSGFESGLIAGILKDLFSVDFLGINTLILAATGILMDGLRANFYKESKMTQMLLVLFAAVFSMTIHYMIESCFSKNLNLSFAEYLTSSIIPSSIYTSLVSIPIFLKFVDIYNLKELEDLL